MSQITLEVIATSPDDCWTIERGGGDRIELCSGLEVGGLTPSLGLLIEARRATALPIMAMVRPRAGGFCYSPDEFGVLLADAELLLRHGADGLVFGCLHPDGAVDEWRTAALVRLAGDRQTVFHRAFDVTPDPFAALDVLAGLGVTRVLSSGQQPSALAGAANLAAYRAHAGERLQILPGGGINLQNVHTVLQQTGADQVHASLSGKTPDRSTAANPALRFGPAALPAEGQVRVTDGALVAAMRQAVDAPG
jgi:copper homeostasis protein